jgi:signal transduction histidine kinase
MNSRNFKTTTDDLAFFGTVNASISHELKNILAIISEAAGLMNDLTEMATSGGDIQLQMLQNCCRDIVDEIQRGFVTIKQMNAFSHSVDDPVNAVDIADCLDLMTGLAGFLSYACRIRYQPSKTQLPPVVTRPFRLQHLIYQTLVYAFKSVGPDGEIHLSLQREKDDAARICFAGIGSGHSAVFPTESAESVAASINAEVSIDDERRTIDIIVGSLDEAGYGGQ